MRLSKEQLQLPIWREAGYSLPEFDLDEIKKNTLINPIWIHFGAGNIFRVFPALAHQKLINQGKADKGIIICECYDEELIPAIYRKYDDLSIAVTLKADGSVEKTVVGSIVESLRASEQEDVLISVFQKPSLQIVSFTITEKGYLVKDPSLEGSIMHLTTKLLLERYLCGALPITFLSMDNCSHNGDNLCDAVLSIADYFVKSGKAPVGFIEYITDPKKVTFPLSMIDKITPRPSEDILKLLQADGLEDAETIKTKKNTYASCFVNAEEIEYLVIEDKFANGRPCWDAAGIIFTDRQTVDKVEKMKVCTCLNPLHTALGTFGCLLGYDFISTSMKDTELVKLIEKIGYDEGLPVVVDPGIISPKSFIDEVLNIRFPNVFVPDTPQRIVCDNSQKIPVRFGETLKAYIERGWDVSKLTYIPLFFAGWLRYLLGVDDFGNEFTISPDPKLETLTSQLKGITKDNFRDAVKQILSDAELFGIDLYEHNLGVKVENYLEELLQGNGAVRSTLKKYL